MDRLSINYEKGRSLVNCYNMMYPILQKEEQFIDRGVSNITNDLQQPFNIKNTINVD